MTVRPFSKHLLCAVLMVTSFASFVRAQCIAKDAGILNARYREGDRAVYVALSKRVNLADLSTSGTANQWRLSDLTALTQIPIATVEPEYIINGETTSIILHLSNPLNIANDYRLQANNLTFLGCVTEDDAKPDVIVKKNRQLGVAQQTQPVKKKNYFPTEKADDRSDSNLYLGGSIDGARGGSPNFSLDIKVDVPRVLTDNSDRHFDVGPYFNLKASTAENGDADSMNFGGKFRLNWNVSNAGPLRYLLWEPALGFESDRRFQNVNLVTSQVITFGIPGNKHTFKKRIRLLPLVGYELGHNLKSPVPEGEGRTISRGLAGAILRIAFDRSEDSSFTFQVDYIRRFLLNREIRFTEDDNKKLSPLFLGKGPRDYVKATAEYGLSKFTAVSFGYEYGRLPPNFKLVDSKYSLGLVFKLKTKFGSK